MLTKQKMMRRKNKAQTFNYTSLVLHGKRESGEEIKETAGLASFACERGSLLFLKDRR